MPRDQIAPGSHGKVFRTEVGPGKWAARTRMRDAYGKRRDVTASGTTGKKAEDAVIAKVKRIATVRVGPAGLTSASRFSVVSLLWIESLKEEDLAPGTKRKYIRGVVSDLNPAIGEVPLSEVSVGMIEELISEILKKGHRSKAHGVRIVLSLVFGYAMRLELLDRNPAKASKSVKVKPKPKEILDKEELLEIRVLIAEFERNATDRMLTPLGDIADTLAGLGVRPNEIFSLVWSDLDRTGALHNGIPVAIIQSSAGENEQGERGRQKTKSISSERTLRMPKFLVEVMDRRFLEAKDRSPDAYVFPSPTGGVFNDSTFRKAWGRFRKGTPFENVSAVTFRKSVATLIADEYGIEIAARQLGHKSPETTRAHYYKTSAVAPDSTPLLDGIFGKDEA